MPGGIPRAQPPPDDLPRLLLWRFRRNPLRRTTDAAQAWIGLGILLAVLAAMPGAMFLIGDTAYRHYTHTARLQAETRHQATAVLLHDSPKHPEPGSDEEKGTRYRVEVRFIDRLGRSHTGRVDVRPGLPAGSMVPVWTGAEGEVMDPPMSVDQIRSRSMGWAIIAALAVALAGAAVYGIAERALRRRNLAAWDTAWARTAPRWTTPT
ncbi:hypothetical protein [Streptomyces shenzhenensis]|uniref:Uncharacterized protein n=1 Tax=Streptomyces shenzhenensis TaxID=943815 RepID=A0A3M0HV65_9ACTN|nr:hypothetical protein [Streptomyces shenzhenensis]RMB80454.1 hypothetical protein CTZ28_40090 [Streptomyces shenzhenensis]